MDTANANHDSASLLTSSRWQQLTGKRLYPGWHRSRVVLNLVANTLWVLFAVALWRHGYPKERVFGLLTIVGVNAVLALVDGRRGKSSEWNELVVSCLVALVTGGLHSPVLFLVAGLFTSPLVRHGWEHTRPVVLSFCAFGVAMALAPDGWTGPIIPEPVYSVSAALLLAMAVLGHVDLLRMLVGSADGAMRELLHTREARATEALSRASELERVGSQLSHELKNPLASVKLLVQLAARAEKDPAIAARLELVEGEVDRLEHIIREHLTLTRPLEPEQQVQVSLGPLVDEVRALLEGRAEAKQVTVHRAGDAVVRGDPKRLKEALLNLVANAIEASRTRGTVEISLGATAQGVELRVSDQGAGMTPEVVQRLGTPFFTTRAGGTGLGVYLAQTVCSQHGGVLRYSSTEGVGTVATAFLPATGR